MANKKIKYTSGDPKTPRLQILKQSDGEFTITYADSDPLGVRSKTTANLDSEIQRLFGYQNWQEYKNENMEDLKKAVISDPRTGQITQAPTVHPFHVAYGLEEFFNRFDIGEYEIVGIPKLEDRRMGVGVDYRMFSIVLQMRKNFFGGKQEKSSSAQAGVLNIAAFFPQEQLINKDIITRIKKRYDFDQIFAEKFVGEMAAKHPEVDKYWKADADSYNDVTGDASGALKISVQRAMADSSLLKEEQTEPNTTDNYFSEDQLTALKGVWLGIQMVDPFGVTSYPDVYYAFQDLQKEPNWANAGYFGFSILGALPFYIGKAAKAGRAAAALSKVDEVADILKAGGQAAGVTGEVSLTVARSVGDKLSDAAAGLRSSGLDEAGELTKLKPDDLAELSDKIKSASETIRSGPYDPKAGGRLRRLGLPAADKLDDLSKTLKTASRSYRPRMAIAQAIGELGNEFVIDAPDLVDRVTGYDPQTDKQAGEEPATGEDLPALQISISKMKFYILPKQWREGKWLTEAEDILAQRIGANTNFLSVPEGEAKAEEDAQWGGKASLKGANVLIFGHSQTGRYGKELQSKVQSAGGKVTKKVHSSNADARVSEKNPGLVTHIKNIEGNYTHAYLFLGGNTGVKGPNYFEAKKEIIDYVKNNLNVPEENILVILPPINMDNKYSRGRQNLNKEATAFFNSIGIKVHPPIVGTSADFGRDGVHIKSNSRLVGRATGGMLSAFSQTTAESVPEETLEKPTGKPPKQDIANIVVQEARKAGVDPILALSIARIESGLNPHSNIDKETRYKGLYQFGHQFRGEWQERYGLDWSKVYDARHNAAAFMNVVKDKVRYLRNKGIIRNSTPGRVDPEEAYLIYLSWQQGSNGITKIVRAAAANQGVPKNIQNYMDNNTYPKTKNITPRQFLSMWKAKMTKFDTQVQRQYASALARPSSRMAESIYLKYLLDEIENIDNELV